jgi:hypothetical protein
LFLFFCFFAFAEVGAFGGLEEKLLIAGSRDTCMAIELMYNFNFAFQKDFCSNIFQAVCERRQNPRFVQIRELSMGTKPRVWYTLIGNHRLLILTENLRASQQLRKDKREPI